jgi:hypothetical protein
MSLVVPAGLDLQPDYYGRGFKDNVVDFAVFSLRFNRVHVFSPARFCSEIGAAGVHRQCSADHLRSAWIDGPVVRLQR